MITGETGSGKTPATKAILADMRPFNVPALILDFKDDYSEPVYAETEGFSVYDPSDQSLPFNRLAPAVDPRSGRVNPTHHLHQLTDIIKRIYRLGDQQAYRLREAMKTVYENAGLPTRAFVPGADQAYPAFEAVQHELAEDKDNQALLGRMSPIFDLELFSSGAQVTDFASVAEQSTVIRLAQLPGDEVKNSVAEFFLMALYNYLIRQPQAHKLARLAVLDEAWRLVEAPFLEPLMREGRAFGLGVVIASQFPTDLPTPVAGSTATKLYFSQTNVEQIRDIQRTILGKTSGADADHLASMMRGLPPPHLRALQQAVPAFCPRHDSSVLRGPRLVPSSARRQAAGIGRSFLGDGVADAFGGKRTPRFFGCRNLRRAAGLQRPRRVNIHTPDGWCHRFVPLACHQSDQGPSVRRDDRAGVSGRPHSVLPENGDVEAERAGR